MNSFRPPWTTLTAIALIALGGFLLRFSIASSEFLWLDELHTSWSTNESLADVAGRAADGNQTPLYFWLIWCIGSVFGQTELSLRSLSVVAGTGSLLVASWHTWKWTSCSIATTLVAWLVAVNVSMIYYGSEARPYALIQLLSVIQVSLFCESLRRLFKPSPVSKNDSQQRPWTFLWLAIVSILLINTHPTSIWLLLMEVMFVLVSRLIQRDRRSGSNEPSSVTFIDWARLVGTAMVVAVGSLPVIIQMVKMYGRSGNWQDISSTSGLWTEIVPEALVLLGLPVAFLISRRVLSHRLGWGSPGSAIQTGHIAQQLAFTFLWAVFPIGSVIALDFFEIAPMALQRYTLVGAIGFPVFAGLCLGHLSGRVGKVVLAGAILVITFVQNPLLESVAWQHRIPQFRFEDWDTPISEINASESKAHHPVFLFSNLIEDRNAFVDYDPQFQMYLLFPVNGLYRLEARGREISAGPTLELTHFSEQQINSIKEQGGGWVIIRGADIINEIGEEVRFRTAEKIGIPLSDVRVSVFDAGNSDVYWLSVDW